MTLSRLIVVMRARWRSATLVIASVVAVAVAISLVLPRQYKATSSVLVDMRSPDPLMGTVLGSTLVSGYMATQMDVVQSERVVRRAIAALGMERDPVLKARWKSATEGQGNFQDWLTEEVQRRLDVQPTRESGVMSIIFTATDPAAAAATANAIVRSYIDTTLELRVEPARQYNDFFDDRSKQLRADLDAAQAKLSSYLQANGIAASNERIDVESLRLSELSSQFVALQSLNAESGSLEKQASVNADKMAEVFNHPAVAALNAELARQQIKLGELRQRLSDQHPQVKETENSISELSSQIAAEKRRVSAGIVASNQVNSSRESQIRSLLAEQRAKVLRMKGQRDEANALQHDVDNARAAYDAVFQRARQSSLESQVTQTNVSILRQATAPALASSPKLWANVSVAFVLGALLALAVVMVREIRDRRLRTLDDVVEGLRQPLLVILPNASGRGQPRKPRPSALKTRIMGSLARPSR
ncbi:MAG: chain length determinant protein EpsF [Cytophagales bacterium]|nr:chain length determinant protein EpsF [Rhizobacter sp.]